MALFGSNISTEGLPQPVVKECEDSITFMKRMAALHSKLKKDLEDLHSSLEVKGEEVPTYAPDEKVWVLRPRPMGVEKTATWWIGPCQVVQKLSNHTYKIQVGETRTRDIHVSQLKRHHPPLAGPHWPLFFTQETPLDGHGLQNDFLVEKILRHRLNKDNNTSEFLVKWDGYGEEECTWEPPSSFLPVFSQPWAAYCRSHHLRVDVVGNLKEG